jgi:hypothetical protein
VTPGHTRRGGRRRRAGFLPRSSRQRGIAKVALPPAQSIVLVWARRDGANFLFVGEQTSADTSSNESGGKVTNGRLNRPQRPSPLEKRIRYVPNVGQCETGPIRYGS